MSQSQAALNRIQAKLAARDQKKAPPPGEIPPVPLPEDANTDLLETPVVPLEPLASRDDAQTPHTPTRGFWDKWGPGAGGEIGTAPLPAVNDPRRRRDGRDLAMGQVLAMAAGLCGVVAEFRAVRPVFDLEIHTWLERQRALLEEAGQRGERVARRVTNKAFLTEALEWRYDPPSGHFEPEVYAVLASIVKARRKQVGSGTLPKCPAANISSQTAHALDALLLKLARSKVVMTNQSLLEAVILGYVIENKSDENPIDLELDTIRDLLKDLGVHRKT